MKKYIKKNTIGTIISLIFAMVFCSVTAYADDVTPRMSQYYLSEGVGHVDYYITSSASSYSTEISNAAYKWEVTGYGWNPIYMYNTTNFNASNMDIYAQNESLYAGYCGYTVHVNVTTNGHVNVSPYSSLWDYGEIYLNTNSNYFGGLNSNLKQGVIGHEMGHVFGLADNNSNIYSIMCQENSGRAVYTPGLADHYGINAMY